MSVLDTLVWCSLSPILNPYAIDDGVEHFPPVFFGHADRIEENITGPCTNRFMGFNASKSGVLVPCVTKASYQQPFECILLLIKRVSFAYNLAFQLPPPFDQWRYNPAEKAVHTATCV